MIDHVSFASPFGPLGRVIDAVALERYMTTLLRQHNSHLRAVAEGALTDAARGAINTGSTPRPFARG